jgi:hypothetical protein
MFLEIDVLGVLKRTSNGGTPMEANRIARLKQSALECADMAVKTRDPRAKAVLATAAIVWAKLAGQRCYHGQSKQAGGLVDLLDTAFIDRESRAISGGVTASRCLPGSEGRNADPASAALSPVGVSDT